MSEYNEDLEQYIEELLQRDQICEMSNFRKHITGLPVNLSLQIETDEDKQYPHNLPRLKFQNNTADRVTGIKDLIPISIDPKDPKVLIKGDYNKTYYKAVRQWIINHYDLLIKFWNQEIDEFDLRDALKKET